MATEKMGRAEEITSFPADYQVLERHADRLKHVYESLRRIVNQYVVQGKLLKH